MNKSEKFEAKIELNNSKSKSNIISKDSSEISRKEL